MPTSTTSWLPALRLKNMLPICGNYFRVWTNMESSSTQCLFGVPEIDFLGHRLTCDGIKPLNDTVQAIENFPVPENKRKLWQFLGLVNFHRRFIPACARTLKPLNDLLSTPGPGAAPLEWMDNAHAAFDIIKCDLATAVLLTHPQPNAPTRLMVDASSKGVGAVLQQCIGDEWKPLAFFSRTLSPAQTWYSTYRRELLAIYLAVKYFCHFLEGRSFYILTDHKPLTHAFTIRSDGLSPREIRQLVFLSKFCTDIRHVAGSANAAADALSRSHISSVTLLSISVDFDKRL